MYIHMYVIWLVNKQDPPRSLERILTVTQNAALH